jgi:hypothetical protein
MSFLTGRSDLSTRTSGTVDVFSGSGVDFTAGSSTTVTLTADPGTENDLVITFDGVTQHHDTYSVSATTVTFDTAIPTGTLKIEAKYGSTYAVGTVPDDAVTLAKMAGGTDGNIISYDTSGNPVAVATGTDGQVLTSSGAGAVCAFEDAGGGAWSYITTITASAAATVEFESQLSSTYGLYMISCTDGHPATDTTHILAQFGVGSTYDTASLYCWLVRGSRGAVDGATHGPFHGGAENSSNIKLIGNEGTAKQSLGNAADEAFAFNFYIPAPSGTTYNKTAFWTLAGSNTANKLFATTGAALNASSDSTAAITSVKFWMNSGNISGTFRLYGLKTS